MDDDEHWVETLFPPTFTMRNVEELKEDRQHSLSLDAMVRRVIPLDTETIRSIYERVLATEKTRTKLMKEAASSDMGQASCQTTATGMHHNGDVGNARAWHAAQLHMRPRSSYPVDTVRAAEERCGAKNAEPERLDMTKHIETAPIHDICPWSVSELATIRRSRHTQDAELKSLRRQVAQLTEECARHASHAAKAACERDDLATRESSLVRNEGRLTILCRELSASLLESHATIARLDSEMAERRRIEAKCKEELAEARTEAGHCGMAASLAKIAASDAAARAEENERIAIMEEKARTSEQLAHLATRLRSAEKELEQERLAHEKSRRALDQLRKHFSQCSIPDIANDMTVKY